MFHGFEYVFKNFFSQKKKKKKLNRNDAEHFTESKYRMKFLGNLCKSLFSHFSPFLLHRWWIKCSAGRSDQIFSWSSWTCPCCQHSVLHLLIQVKVYNMSMCIYDAFIYMDPFNAADGKDGYCCHFLIVSRLVCNYTLLLICWIYNLISKEAFKLTKLCTIIVVIINFLILTL